MKFPIVFTAPRGKGARLRESTWGLTREDFERCGTGDPDGDDWEPKPGRLLDKIEMRRFAKACVEARVWIVIEGHDGTEWWAPGELLRRVEAGRDEFSPSMHQYRLFSPSVLADSIDEDARSMANLARLIRSAGITASSG
jgi:hypothetical protein